MGGSITELSSIPSSLQQSRLSRWVLILLSSTSFRHMGHGTVIFLILAVLLKKLWIVPFFGSEAQLLLAFVLFISDSKNYSLAIAESCQISNMENHILISSSGGNIWKVKTQSEQRFLDIDFGGIYWRGWWWWWWWWHDPARCRTCSLQPWISSSHQVRGWDYKLTSYFMSVIKIQALLLATFTHMWRHSKVWTNQG